MVQISRDLIACLVDGRCLSAKSRRGTVVFHCVLTWAQVSGHKDNALTRVHDPDAPDPAVGEFRTSELGAMLRESRVTLGRKLEDVAAELRIRLVYLQAIEEGQEDIFIEVLALQFQKDFQTSPLGIAKQFVEMLPTAVS